MRSPFRPSRAGAVACPAAAVAATFTAVLRIAADRHWATDVIAGAALGGALGYAVPALHLAAAGSGTKADSPTAVISPVIGGSTFGITVAGRF